MKITTVFSIAQKIVRTCPESLGRGLFNTVGTVAGSLPLGGTKQLKRNQARIRPNMTARQARSLARAGMRSYMRYYYEVLRLGSWDDESVQRRVVTRNFDHVHAEFDAGRALPATLMHMGNWDLAGAWACNHLAPVHTLVEKLEPEELFTSFVDFRESLGMTIYPVVKGAGAIHNIVRDTEEAPVLSAILADRDLTSSGIPVEFFGEKMMVAAGPAIVAQETGRPIACFFSYYKKAKKREGLGTRWRMILASDEFVYPKVEKDASPREKQADIERMSQEWVSRFEKCVSEHLEDWHMLQKVFVADLDPERFEAGRRRWEEIMAKRQREWEAKEEVTQ
ncbi:phosphatidylinositol mannoside acyltransferase [Actinotignum urinale]|uniref:Phosphatidylinositol mannoside acyltransferase n=1 Tax=Actinotignum urinale TaxID=190146 RepID=A0AAW9HUH7_9ACTO|nr:phosphatidylinositol mannoside acyltransferase [Actinotignum urinale]MDY5129497.1 phosphatidylinositol mannoside acyltransferase [Actinotignum urinale]MDY5132158.1 phosphatidylinositol mannoside acyltransferase [Actinotignum urinale]MDY5155383.1 phosphatidylinositol mannoside acyltransferase [Actinotignum urinale]MDY5160914.1 phosphatidylinositol mannoside acyltransferase [Actinotignum urinale]